MSENEESGEQMDLAECTYALIGMMLSRPDSIEHILPYIRTYRLDGQSKIAVDIIAELVDDKRPIDLNILSTEFLRRGKIAALGGGEKAKSFMLACSALALKDIGKVSHYLRYLEISTRLARLGVACQSVIAGTCEPCADPDALISKLKEQMDNLIQSNDSSIVTMAQIFRRYFPDLVALQTGQIEIPAISTTFADLDKAMCGGMYPGEAMVITAPTKGGKTTIATQILQHHVLHSKYDVLLVSLEMSPIQLFQRLLSQVYSIPLNMIREGSIPLSEEDYTNIELAYGAITWNVLCDAVEGDGVGGYSKVKDLERLWVEPRKGLTSSEVCNSIYRVKSKVESLGRVLKLIVVDYIQKLRPDRSSGNREVDINLIVQRLVDMGKDIDIPIILLSQINKEGDVRESQSIKHHTDTLIRMETNLSENQTTLYVELGRMHGSGASIPLEFNASIGMYRQANENVPRTSRKDRNLADSLGI